MKLLTCITTFNRLPYTKRCVESYMDTLTSISQALVVVDNGSTDGTREYLEKLGHGILVVFNDQNLFPGAATNIGWHEGLKKYDDHAGGPSTHLHRSDNDVEFLPGWQKWVERTFKAFGPKLGQLGLLNAHEDFSADATPFDRDEKLSEHGTEIYPVPTGGNCVIPRGLWDEGVRWIPGGWSPGGRDEDTLMSMEVQARGLLVGRLVATVANNMSFGRYEDFPDYYQATAAMRGLTAETSV